MEAQQTITKKEIVAIRKAVLNKRSAFNIKQVIPTALPDVDPFVFLDHFGPFERDPNEAHFNPHPHAGIATISYLYTGTSYHVTSVGSPQIVQPGDVALMQAGSGIEHAEGLRKGQTNIEIFHGLQFWISLPAKDKMIKPDVFFYPKKNIPQIIKEGATINVVCGELFGNTSPVQLLSPAYLYDISMKANSTLRIPVQPGYSCALFVSSGAIQCNGELATAETIIQFDEEAEGIAFSAEVDARLAIFGGQPLREPVVFHGPFVMNSKEQIKQIIKDYDNGKFGTVNTGSANK